MHFRYSDNVFQNAVIADAGKLPVNLIIHVFNIHENAFQKFKDILYLLPFKVAAGFNGSINAKPVAGSHKLSQEFRLHEWLSAGESDSTSGLTIENGVSFDYFQNIFNSNGRAYVLPGTCRTHGAAFTASPALLPI
jgi:hypothetical protein